MTRFSLIENRYVSKLYIHHDQDDQEETTQIIQQIRNNRTMQQNRILLFIINNAKFKLKLTRIFVIIIIIDKIFVLVILEN